jgi:dihydroorotate dehydrogenase electron transfer subunit
MGATLQHIIDNHCLGGGFFRMRVTADDRILGALPGQFVMIRIGAGDMPLLRRPFSIHRLVDGPSGPAFEILYRVVGIGTRAMADMNNRQTIDVLGPLGRGFAVGSGMKRGVIMAGGVGVAPMVFLAEYLVKRESFACLDVFLGARTRDELLCRKEFTNLNIPLHVTTDDGSCGDRCLVTMPAADSIRAHRPDMVFACGPLPMLRCVIDMAGDTGVKCQISTEAVMACGLGACLGCAVADARMPGHYLHACIDGPVFPSDQIRI